MLGNLLSASMKKATIIRKLSQALTRQNSRLQQGQTKPESVQAIFFKHVAMGPPVG